ncbi:MAG: glycoside hydrolase [Chloroflexi bacterium]|nr:glycoside hydrolase [Chloroflexota bacterium]
MKDVFVILAFHAHEPLWDLSRMLLDAIDDPRIKATFPADNWIVKRLQQGRDIYQDLLRFAAALDAPVALEATNEVLEQIATYSPDTFRDLRAAYRTGTLYPVYGHAYHTHIALMSDQEVAEEIRLNQEFLHGVMGAPRPRYRGLFPTEGSLDARKLGGLRAAGVDYVLMPNLSPRKARYQVHGTDDVVYRPFTIGDGLLALPRHYPVSQLIWRPITRWAPDGVKLQGFLLGRFLVFDEEYRSGTYLAAPISWRQAVADYRAVLEDALAQAPHQGLILYLQDLELMDFGDVALKLMQEAWQEVRAHAPVNLHFVTPDHYLDAWVQPRRKRLGRVTFDQVSWAPEVRVLLRYDGHYPPLDAGPYRGLDFALAVFARWPFIFWEPGRYLVRATDALLRGLGYPTEIGVSAARLHALGNHFGELEEPGQVAYHCRVMKRACNWGWQPDETRQKWPYLHAWCILDLLRRDLAQGRVPAAAVRAFTGLPPRTLDGLEGLLDLFLDGRAGYLEYGLQQQLVDHPSVARGFEQVAQARAWRRAAQAHLQQARIWNSALQRESGAGRALDGLLAELQGHCAALVLGTDRLQRAWGTAADLDALVIAMYDYLYACYPPRFPRLLAALEGEPLPFDLPSGEVRQPGAA